MLALVRVATARLRKRLAAHPTLVRLFSRVCQLVLLEARHLGKSLDAPVKLARVGALPGVRPDVVFEVARRRECLAALGVGTDKRPLARVHAPVNVEVLRRIEALAAARKLALARAIRDVNLLYVGAEVGREREGTAAAGMVALVRSVLLLLHALSGVLGDLGVCGIDGRQQGAEFYGAGVTRAARATTTHGHGAVFLELGHVQHRQARGRYPIGGRGRRVQEKVAGLRPQR